MKTIVCLFDKLIRPSPSITQPEIARSVKVLNALLLVFMFGVCLLGVRLLIIDEDKASFVIIGLCLLFLGVSLAICKTRHYVMGGGLFAASIFSSCFFAMIAYPQIEALAVILTIVLIPPVILSSSLPFRASIFVNLLGLVTLFVLPSLWVGWILFLPSQIIICVIILVVIAVGSFMRQRDMHQLEIDRANLFEQSKLSELGKMTAGIAHEINNPMAIITLRSSQVLRLLAANGQKVDERLVEFIKDINTTSVEVAKIIKSMSSLARNGNFDPFERVKLKQVLEASVRLCQAQMSQDGVLLTIEPYSEDIELDCKPSQIQQVLLNLLNNAKSANLQLPISDKWVKILVQDMPEKINIEISDNGCGIPVEHVTRIMQPFFTTKPNGSGTGLGLSISLRIAKEHGGNLWLDTTSSHTKFILQLPKKQDD